MASHPCLCFLLIRRLVASLTPTRITVIRQRDRAASPLCDRMCGISSWSSSQIETRKVAIELFHLGTELSLRANRGNRYDEPNVEIGLDCHG
jgi:hypothetical protein